MWCWMNGQFIRDTDIMISPFDHGFLYGIGFFETFRTYNGEPFLFDEHLERLEEALRQYRIRLPYTKEELMAVIHSLNEKEGGTDGYFRLNVSAGNGGIGLQPSQYDEPNVIIFRKELPDVVREKNAVWLNTVRNSPEQEKRYKSHHYANNVLGRLEVPSLKDVEGFYVNAKGDIAEGVTSNIFWVKDSVLFTPATETGILDGITRRFVLHLADELNIPTEEGYFPKEVLERADEVFVTTSIQELIAIRAIDTHQFEGEVGPIFKRLLHLYKKKRGLLRHES